MKRVNKNLEVARAWANLENATTANFQAAENVLFSYETPIGHILPDGTALIDWTLHSTTTRKHQALALRAALGAGRPVAVLPLNGAFVMSGNFVEMVKAETEVLGYHYNLMLKVRKARSRKRRVSLYKQARNVRALYRKHLVPLGARDRNFALEAPKMRIRTHLDRLWAFRQSGEYLDIPDLRHLYFAVKPGVLEPYMVHTGLYEPMSAKVLGEALAEWVIYDDFVALEKVIGGHEIYPRTWGNMLIAFERGEARVGCKVLKKGEMIYLLRGLIKATFGDAHYTLRCMLRDLGHVGLPASTVEVGSLPNEAVFVTDSQERAEVLRSIGKPRAVKHYGSLFVLLGNAEYDQVWGCHQAYPHQRDQAYLLYDRLALEARIDRRIQGRIRGKVWGQGGAA